MASDCVSSVQGQHSVSGSWIGFLGYFCLRFSLPFSIWLYSGWMGLLLHWHADFDPARLLGRILRKPAEVYGQAI